MKIPVMIELFHQVNQGKLKLDDPLTIKNEFHSIVDGSIYTLSAKDDSELDKAYEKGLNNTTTARGLAILLQAIAEGKAVDAESCKEMIAVLERQKFNEGIPAGLPQGTPVAHKTGEITKIHHDAAIVFAKRPFILVILVRGLVDIKESSALMADVSKSLYEATE